MIVLGLAVVATVVLLAVVPKDGSLGGVRAGSSTESTGATPVPGVTTTTVAGTTETTVPGATATTKGATTTTTKKGSTAATTTTINPATLPLLKKGDSGPNVVLLQQKLTAAGFNPGTADGNFGNGTETAVINFQKSKNLPADGIVGTATWTALG